MHLNKYSIAGNGNTLMHVQTLPVNLFLWSTQDASLKASADQWPPVPQRQGWEADEQQEVSGAMKRGETNIFWIVLSLQYFKASEWLSQ